jgi:hypothetical protein
MNLFAVRVSAKKAPARGALRWQRLGAFHIESVMRAACVSAFYSHSVQLTASQWWHFGESHPIGKGRYQIASTFLCINCFSYDGGKGGDLDFCDETFYASAVCIQIRVPYFCTKSIEFQNSLSGN